MMILVFQFTDLIRVIKMSKTILICSKCNNPFIPYIRTRPPTQCSTCKTLIDKKQHNENTKRYRIKHKKVTIK
jgi:hypothetical protein